MSFQEPYYLFALAAGPLLALLGLFSLKRGLRRLKGFSRIFPELLDGNTTAHWVKGILLSLCALLLITFALAGPERDEKGAHDGARALDIAMVFDTSRSMLAREAGLSRMEEALRDLRAWTPSSDQDRCALIAFAGKARLLCPLTFDRESYGSFTEELNILTVPEGGSALSEGLSLALDLLEKGREDKPKVVVLISDGEDIASGSPPEEVAALARSRGIRIHTVMFGSPKGAKIPRPEGEGFLTLEGGEDVISKPNPALMARIATAGGGGFIQARDVAFPLQYLESEHLAECRAPVSKDDGSMARRPVFQWFVFAALALLLVDCFIPFRIMRRGGGAFAVLLLLAWPSAACGEDALDAAREGMRLYRAGDHAAALECFEKAARELEGHPDLLVNLGLTHLKLEDPEKAASCFDQVLAEDPGPAFRAARFGSGLARFRQAEFLLNRSIRLKGKDKVSALRLALRHARSARQSFAAGIETGFWPEDGAVNLALSDGMVLDIEKRLAESGALDPDKAEGDASEAKEDGDAAAGMQEQETARGESTGRQVRGKPDASPLSPEERKRIFERMREMEQERIALERAEAGEAEARSKGGSDR